MARKVYIVTSGTYSDYGIEAVFTSRALAQLYLDKYTDDWSTRIEEWDLNPGEKILRQGMAMYRVWMSEAGESEYCYKAEIDAKEEILFRPRVDGSTSMDTIVVARDEQHAIKIAAEQHAQAKAMGLWGKEINSEEG